MAFGLNSIFKRPPPVAGRAWLKADRWPTAVYAIGDVHGCLGALKAAEEWILEDGEGREGPLWIVYLGDLIDRGPASAGVLDHLLARLPAKWRRMAIAGNHESMMLEFLKRQSGPWLENGGLETLQSYGVETAGFLRTPRRLQVQILESHIPREHIELLESLPIGVSLPATTLVHAGIRPGIPLESQSERDLLWIRSEFLDALLPEDQLVVHGHTPAQAPQIAPGRLGIDTGAFATGRLTVARLCEGAAPVLFTTTP